MNTKTENTAEGGAVSNSSSTDLLEDPFESKEYTEFCEEMAKHCTCYPDCPCDGVLAGGPCDERIEDDEPWEDEPSSDDCDFPWE